MRQEVAEKCLARVCMTRFSVLRVIGCGAPMRGKDETGAVLRQRTAVVRSRNRRRVRRTWKANRRWRRLAQSYRRRSGERPGISTISTRCSSRTPTAGRYPAASASACVGRWMRRCQAGIDLQCPDPTAPRPEETAVRHKGSRPGRREPYDVPSPSCGSCEDLIILNSVCRPLYSGHSVHKILE